MPDITINGISVNTEEPRVVGPLTAAPLRGIAPTLSRLADATRTLPAAGTRYALVQVKAPLTANDRKKLEDVGAAILEFVPVNTYICRYDPEDLLPVRNLPFVLWAGPYLRGFKVAAALSPVPASRMSLLDAAAGPVNTLSSTPSQVDILFHRDANAAVAAENVARAVGLDPADVKPDGNKVRLTVQANRLADVARLDEVRSIEPVVANKLHNNIARTILGIDPPGTGSLPFEGSGQRICVADTGFDEGSTTTNVHPAFTNRVHKLYALGRPNKSNDPHGHGTHVAGSVLGNATSTVLGVNIRGTAPQAHLVLQSVLDASGGLGGLPANLRNLFDTPYRSDDVRVHTNSWGSTLGDSRYDSQSLEVDDFVWNHRDCVICFSAGNEGTDTDADGIVDRASITPPATAKNCITIGATENNRSGETLTYGAAWPANFPSNPLFSDLTADNPDGMVAFSSRGPTSDLRFKPDVVAPGTFILSARSQATSGVAWGLANANEPLYMYDGGTSMATPLVAGCCALIREYLIGRRNISNPSAALVKAMLINGARDIPGQYSPPESGPIPNFSEGFGRVDMQATLGSGEPQIILAEDENKTLDTGEEQAFKLTIPNGTTDLKITLVWTDPPGATLQNDLDLIVRIGNQERHGNMPPNSSGFDRANNVEQVVWSAIPAGEVNVIVRAFQVAQFPQSFALVARAR